MVRRFFTRRDDTSEAAKGPGPEARRSRRRPALEALEHRTLLSFAGSLRQVSAIYGDNYAPANASSPNGTSVAVWINNNEKTSPHLYAQRFDTQGDPTGPVIIVDDNSTAGAYETAVALDASGRFVVAWQDYNTATRVTAIEMRAYSAAGAPLTGVTRVATAAAGTVFGPSVAASNGSFVIAYDRYTGTYNEVLAQRYTYASGVPVGHGTFIVDASGQGDDLPSVAMAPDGRFDIAYEHYTSPIKADVDLARYTAAGTLAGRTPVSIAAGLEPMPSVAMDDSGNAVVAYVAPDAVSYNIVANRVTAAGAVSPRITVADDSVANYGYPSVALSPVGGDFAVADYNTREAGVHVQQIAASNAVLGDFDMPYLDGFGDEAAPSISIDGYDRLFVTYTARPGSNDEVYSHRALLPSYPAQQVSTTAGDNLQTRNASSANGTSVVTWVNTVNSSNHDLYAQRFDAQGRPAGAPIAVDVSAADSYDPVVAMDASGRFIVAWEDLDDAIGGDVIEMRAYSASGAPLTPITRVSGPATGGTDFGPTVAASDGSFVVAYVHSGDGYDIYARRYTYASGVPVGHGTFVVANMPQGEVWPSIAMAPDGRFDIAYEFAYSPSDHDIYLARYTAAGAFAGTSYVNDDTNLESTPSVSMDNAGIAVVAYVEAIGYPTGIFANRVSAAGVVGPRITVAYGGGSTYYSAPSVALSPTTGAFVVAFNTNLFSTKGGFGAGFYAMEFSASDAAMEPLYNALGSPDDAAGVSVSIDGHGRYLVTFTLSNGTHKEVDSFRDFLAT
jgi:hypothetical protein